jgi:hypothetical protein
VSPEATQTFTNFSRHTCSQLRRASAKPKVERAKPKRKHASRRASPGAGSGKFAALLRTTGAASPPDA